MPTGKKEQNVAKGERFDRAGNAAARRAARDACRSPPRRSGRGLGFVAARDPDVPGRLPASHPAARRAHRHQSGGRGLQPGPPLDHQLPHRAEQSVCRRGAVQHAGRLRRRNFDRGGDRTDVFLDRGAHQHAVQALHRGGEHPTAVRAAAGRRRRLDHPRLAQDRPDQHHVQVAASRFARRFLFAAGLGLRVRHLLRALRLHVHRLGLAQHGPEPGRGRRNFRRQRLRHAVFGDVPADHAGDHLRHAAVVHRDARHLRYSGGARRADQHQRAHHLHLQAHQLVAAALQHRGGGRDHPHDGDRGAGFSAAEGGQRAQLRHRRRQGLPPAQSRSRAVALAHVRLRHHLSDRRRRAADAGADRGGVPQIHVHPRCRQPVRHEAILADALPQHLRQSALTLNSIYNAVEVGVITALAGGALAFAIGYTIHRTHVPGRRSIDLLSTLPVAIPGLVIGVAYLWAWIGIPGGLYGTLWILALAFIARFMPDTVKALSTSFLQIHRELEEAAWVCGTGMLRTIRTIVLPLASPGVIAAMTLLFVLAIRELGSSLFLYTSNTMVMSVLLLDYYEGGNLGKTAAFSLVQTVLLGVLIGGANWLARGAAQGSVARTG